MKNVLIAALVLFTTNVFATSNNVKFVAVDQEAASDICIIAAQEGISAARKAALGVAKFTSEEFNGTTCNGKNIRRFALQFKADKQEVAEIAKNVEYRFKPLDDSRATQLCKVAAEDGFEAAVKVGGTDVRELFCNGERINRFARRFNKA